MIKNRVARPIQKNAIIYGRAPPTASNILCAHDITAGNTLFVKILNISDIIYYPSLPKILLRTAIATIVPIIATAEAGNHEK